jgi:hypothetical protein
MVQRMTSVTSSRSGRHAAPEAVDTRSPAGPEGRVYAVPFASVWDRLISEVARRSRWELVHQDEDLGLITVACRGVLPGRSDDLTLWVRLDGNALTRVDARCELRSRRGAGVGERRVSEILKRLDAALGPAARVSG